jgi:hypothetical protein
MGLKEHYVDISPDQIYVIHKNALTPRSHWRVTSTYNCTYAFAISCLLESQCHA